MPVIEAARWPTRSRGWSGWLRTLAAAGLLAGCSSGSNNGTPAVAITPSGTVQLAAGDSLQLAAASSTGGAIATPVTWVSSNVAVATVTQAGLVLGVAPGGAAITASAASFTSGEVTVSVTPAGVAQVAIVSGGVGLALDSSATLHVQLIDKLGKVATGTVSWSVANPAVALVDQLGKVTGVAGGETTVSAAIQGLSASVAAVVSAPASGSVGPAGGTVGSTSGTGRVALNIPPGGVGSLFGVTLTPVTETVSSLLRLPGTGVVVGLPALMNTPPTVSIRYASAALPSGVLPPVLQALARVNNVWLPLPNPVVDPVAQTVSAPVPPLAIPTGPPPGQLGASPTAPPGSLGTAAAAVHLDAVSTEVALGLPPLAFVAPPSSVQLGAAPVTVTVQLPPIGTRQLDPAAAVNWTVNGTGAVTVQTVSVTAQAIVGQVTGTTAGPVTLTVDAQVLPAPGLPGDRFASLPLPLQVLPLPATQLAIATQPSASAGAGVPFAAQPVIQLKDAGGNAVFQSGVVVTATLASGTGTLGGTTTATSNANGVAAFTNLSLSPIGTYTLRFSATLSGQPVNVASQPIVVSPPPATQLAFATEPSATATAGVPFVVQPVIQLKDGNGNAVSQSGVVVSVGIATGIGTLSGTVTATTNANGAATFTNLALSPAGSYTIRFSATLSGQPVNVTSQSIVVSSPAATQLAITTQPSAAATSTVPFTAQPVIQLKDANGNAVSQSGVVVTAAIATGTGALGGTPTATTNANGAATFTNLSLSPVGAYTLRFSATLNGQLATVTSQSIVVSAPPATHLTITTQPPSPVCCGYSFASYQHAPVIQLRDAQGFAVAQSGVAVTASIVPGGTGPLSGTLTVLTNSSGAAIFGDLSLVNVGTASIKFSATLNGQPVSVTSQLITIESGLL